MSDNKIHNKRYYFLAFLAIAMGVGLVLLPEKSNHKQFTADQLLSELNDPTRFVSSDEVADLIIQQDPTLLLVDVRNEEDFNAFSLPGAMNIPLGKLLEKEAQDIIGRDDLSIVFYSNDDIDAEKAWMVNRRKELITHVMKGGLNRWAETILNPPKPHFTADRKELNLYQFRMGANQYFAGAAVEIEPAKFEKTKRVVRKVASKPAAPQKKKTVKLLPKKVEEDEEEEEGC